MPGGLIQLVIAGIQDSPIIGNPEITFFKTVYKQHTQFSVCQNERFIGKLGFNKESSKVIENNGDLLYNLYFKLEIPYFEIIKEISNTNNLLKPYNINELSVTYKNMNCIVFYVSDNDSWYLIPNVLFSLSNFTQYITLIDSSLAEEYILPDYIKTVNYGKYINYYQILDNTVSSLINLLRLNSSYWEQYWLDSILTNNILNYNNPLITLKSNYTSIYTSVKNRIFNLYWKNNYTNLNNDYFNLEFRILEKDNSGNDIMKTETERYFEYVNSIENAIKYPYTFDIDIVYKYCKDNFLNFIDYRDNILNNNTKCLLLILSLLYSNNTITYTFWKKYNIGDYNKVNTISIVSDTHKINEWQENFNIFMAKIFETNDITNIIYKEFNTSFFNTEQIISNLFNSLNLNNPKDLYIKLKTITDQFNLIPNYQINFNKGFLATYYVATSNQDINSLYNQDNYDYLLVSQTNNYSSLNTISSTLSTNENNNLTPVDITNIYSIIANDVIDNEFKLVDSNSALKSFIVLWRNVVVNRLYSNYLDVYNKSSSINDTDRKMAFYYNIIPANMFSTSEFNSSFYEMFFKNSWFGSLSIENNDFLKFKENIFKVDVNTLGTDFSNLITNNNFNKLSITNTYTFINYPYIEATDNYGRINFKKVIFDSTNNLLYIKYDNIYNSNTTITLMINMFPINYSSISQKNSSNEYNFNSIYLIFSGITIESCPDYATISLTVTYIDYIPALYFYQPNLKYSKLTTNKYYLLTKLSNNKININNISNSYIDGIESSFISGIPLSLVYSLDIILLTINYHNNMLVRPDKINLNNINIITTTQTKTIGPGIYSYGISYYTSNYESELSLSTLFTIINDQTNYMVKLTNLPISNNKSVIGRKLYRTKANESNFLLLIDIHDNTTLLFNDTVNDDILGIDYNINNNIKYKTLSENNINVTKLPIKISIFSGQYKVSLYSGGKYALPTYFDDIYEIYIETFNNNSSVITNISGSLNTIGEYNKNSLNTPINTQIITANNKKILNYLVNSSNLMDIHKLVYSKRIYPFNLTNIFKLFAIPIVTQLIEPGKYYYSISLYNTNTQLETFPNNDPNDNSTTITLTTNQQTYINNLTPIYDSSYNSYKIYRSHNLDNNNNNKTLYYLATISSTIAEYYDNIPDSNLTNNNIIKDAEFIILDNIFPDFVNRPGNNLIINNNVSYFGIYYNPLIYVYVITYKWTDPSKGTLDTFETVPSDQSYILVNNFINVAINLPISPDSRVYTRVIYRSNAIASTSITLPIPNNNLFLLKVIDNNTETNYMDTDGTVLVSIINPPLSALNRDSYEIPYGYLNEVNIFTQSNVPNIYPFISHTTDSNFMNTKGMSDINDFLFNKSFIMMSNNSDNETFTNTSDLINSFTTPNLYFYNINFKINSTSVITLNDRVVNYLLPVSTQEFFYKESNDKYYNIVNNNIVEIKSDQITELYFNPSFDEINIFPDFLVNNKYYGSVMIDLMIEQIDLILKQESDYTIITNTIDTINNYFINLCTNF